MKRVILLIALAVLALAACAAPESEDVDSQSVAADRVEVATAETDDLSVLYEKYIHRLVPTAVIAKTWKTPEELPLDELLIVYQIDVIHPNRDAYDLDDDTVYDKDSYCYLIKADIIEEYVQRLFGVDQDLMRTCDGDSGRYNAEKGVYEIVSGLGGAWGPDLVACEQEGGLLKLFLDFVNEDGSHNRQQVLTLRMNGDDFQYISNTLATGEMPMTTELMSDKDLIDRTLYLFDPFVTPIPWWTATGSHALDVYEIDVDPLENTPEYTQFFQVLRFNSIAEVKRATEQAVTKEMAEKLYHNIDDLPPYFLERDGALYLNTEIGSGAPPYYPVSATVISKAENEALLSVVFLGPDNEEEIKEVELIRENGTWKLNNHPYYDWLDREQE